MIDLPPDQLEQVRELVRLHLREGRVFAFGSRVSGKSRKFSDLDLMVKADGGVPWRTLADIRESFESSDLPITVDVIDWDSCTEQFRRIVEPQLVRVI